MRYLTAQGILVLHALVIDATGGSHGVHDTTLLASIAHKPSAQYGSKDLYPNLFQKTAVLLEAIANYHVFIDGNKRTSLIVAARFLHLNGYELQASNEDTERTVLAVATKKIDIAELTKWFEKNSSKRVK